MRYIAYIIVALLALSCSNDLQDVMKLPKNKFTPSQIGDSVTMIYTDSAQLKIMVKANRLLLFEKNVSEQMTVMPKGVFVTFFDEDENISATLKGNYAVVYDVSKRMEVKHAVEVVNRNGEKLETEKLIWNELTRKIYTDAFVKITKDKEVIMGQGMESNQDFTKYQLKKVTGTIQLKSDDQ